jgi:hypothetical protein
MLGRSYLNQDTFFLHTNTELLQDDFNGTRIQFKTYIK